MNDQFIQSILIDWGKIEEDSYIRNINAIRSLEELPDSYQVMEMFINNRKQILKRLLDDSGNVQ